MSGFFFCGMIDEPVDQPSSRTAQPNSRDAQRQISSPRRDRCTPTIAATNRNSATKSRSLTASIELAIAPVKPSSRATACGSSSRAEPARAPAPSGDSAGPDVPVGQPVEVAAEGVGVLGQLVAERHGLGVLEVGESGRGAVDVRLGLVGQGQRRGRPGPRRSPGTGRAGRGAGRWPPGRCGCARRAACRRPGRAARGARARWRCGRPRRPAWRRRCRRRPARPGCPGPPGPGRTRRRRAARPGAGRRRARGSAAGRRAPGASRSAPTGSARPSPARGHR